MQLPTVGGAEDLETVIRDWSPERVVICRPDFSPPAVLDMIDTCRRYSVKAGVVPGTVDAFGPSLEVDEVEGVTVLGVNPPILGRGSRALKRGFDLLVAGALLLLAAPVMAVVAIAIKLDSRGPVLFRQSRVGRSGRAFDLIKFRTMRDDAEQRREELMSRSRDRRWLDLEQDPRITRIGRILRRSSLDELPQLLNVIRGEMSMVGPRPLPAEEDAQVDGWARGRLDLTPGITGLWQVLGRTQIPFDEMVKLDYIYVTNWSLWGDLRLLLRTLPAVLSGRGVN
jgi:exopolysaccharide biosynthesis polyprenyl glycosylphosphotransferase